MAGPQTPGLGPGTWLFGCWVCQRLWPSRHHLQGTHRKGPRWDCEDSTHMVTVGVGEAPAACLSGPHGGGGQQLDPAGMPRRSTRWTDPALGPNLEVGFY